MKVAALAFAVLGSVVPAWGIWIVFTTVAAYGQWRLGHMIMLAIPLLLELLVLVTTAAVLLNRKRLALWAGGLSMVSTIGLIVLVVVAAGQFASRWH